MKLKNKTKITIKTKYNNNKNLKKLQKNKIKKIFSFTEF